MRLPRKHYRKQILSQPPLAKGQSYNFRQTVERIIGQIKGVQAHMR